MQIQGEIDRARPANTVPVSDTLADWSEPPVATDIPAAGSGNTTTYTLPESADPRRFYRVALLP